VSAYGEDHLFESSEANSCDLRISSSVNLVSRSVVFGRNTCRKNHFPRLGIELNLRHVDGELIAKFAVDERGNLKLTFSGRTTGGRTSRSLLLRSFSTRALLAVKFAVVRVLGVHVPRP